MLRGMDDARVDGARLSHGACIAQTRKRPGKPGRSRNTCALRVLSRALLHALPDGRAAEDRLAAGYFQLLSAVDQLDALGLELGVYGRIVAFAVTPCAVVLLDVPQRDDADEGLVLVLAAALGAGRRQAEVLDDLRGQRPVLRGIDLGDGHRLAGLVVEGAPLADRR